MQVVTADYVVIVVMQCLERAWPWFKKRLEDISDHRPQMVETGRGVLFALPPEVIDRVRRLGTHRTLLGT